MGSLDEFSFALRLFLRTYPWRRIDPLPWAPLRRPLAESSVAIVSSGGFTSAADPFDHSVRGGDFSFRVIRNDVRLEELVNSHRSESFDHAGLLADPNLAFPLDRLRELVAAGRVGAASSIHLSFMGSITAPGRLVRDTAPRAADALVEAGVDVALLVPV